MKAVVLITGANGMVAKHLSKILENDYEIRFLTRKKSNENEFEWNIEKGFVDLKALVGVKHIIHLAGTGIVDKRWTTKQKKAIVSSRVDSAKLIFNTLKKQQIKIESFISSSAIGFYGTKTTSIIYDENSEKGNDFLSDVCHLWENIAQQFETENIANRAIIFRTGIILSKNGGALQKMIFPIKYFIGSILGSGNQYMPWIHIEDLCQMIQYALQHHLKGIYNAVASEHINNKDFTLSLAKRMNRKIWFFNIPKFIIRFVFGKASVLLLEGSRVSSKKIREQGFKFKYDNLNLALDNLID